MHLRGTHLVVLLAFFSTVFGRRSSNVLPAASSEEEGISAVSRTTQEDASSAAYLSYVRNSNWVGACRCAQTHVKK